MCFWEISGSYTHTPYPDDVTINMNNLIDVKFINIFYHKNLNKNLYIRKRIKEICCTRFFGFRSKPSFPKKSTLKAPMALHRLVILFP